MSDAGVLTAELDGPNVKFTMQFPADYDHAFMVERLAGNDEYGNEIWEPIHSGPRKFVCRDEAWHMARTPDDPDAEPEPRHGTYRAIAYRLAEEAHRPGGVKILHTEGDYTDPVTV